MFKFKKRKKRFDISSLERKNFKAKDSIYSDTAKREGIDNNVYDLDVLINLNRTMDKAQEVRDLLGCPLFLSNAHRCLELNRAIGSKDTSSHIRGMAFDGYAPSYGSEKDIVLAIREANIVVDVCLIEDGCFHLAIKETGNNRNIFGSYINKKFKRI